MTEWDQLARDTIDLLSDGTITVSLAGGGSATVVNHVDGARESMSMSFGEGSANVDSRVYNVHRSDLPFVPVPGCLVTDARSGVSLKYVVDKVDKEVGDRQWKLTVHRMKAQG